MYGKKTRQSKAKRPTVKKKKTALNRAPAQSRDDIVQMILQDHKPLKKWIKVLKGEATFAQKQTAFDEFAPLLISHAKPEEQALYVAMKKIETLRAEGFEGDTEHGIADQLVEEIKRTDDEDLWMARVKVLAELVEHHIEEEEDEMLPDYRKKSDLDERIELGHMYANLKKTLEDRGGEDSPSEKTKTGRGLTAEMLAK